MKLLGRKTSGNVQKVLWLLEELKLPYEREDYGRQFNNTQTAEYLGLNPNAKVPTLVDGEVIIWESNTILRYLANKAKSPLYPSDPAKRSADFANQEKDLGAQLSILDKAMGKWVAGDEMSIADICLGPIVYRCLRFGVELPALPNVKRWDAAISSRDAFKKATAA